MSRQQLKSRAEKMNPKKCVCGSVMKADEVDGNVKYFCRSRECAMVIPADAKDYL